MVANVCARAYNRKQDGQWDEVAKRAHVVIM